MVVFVPSGMWLKNTLASAEAAAAASSAEKSSDVPLTTTVVVRVSGGAMLSLS